MTDLIQEFVEAYPAYVKRRCAALGLPYPGDAVAAGQGWLRSELVSLLQQPFAEQRRGPLELFQEAMKFPTAALREHNVDPSPRDEAANHALPGDVYDLAPASSQDLGEGAWLAHLGWGAAKAKALGG